MVAPHDKRPARLDTNVAIAHRSDRCTTQTVTHRNTLPPTSLALVREGQRNLGTAERHDRPGSLRVHHRLEEERDAWTRAFHGPDRTLARRLSRHNL